MGDLQYVLAAMHIRQGMTPESLVQDQVCLTESYPDPHPTVCIAANADGEIGVVCVGIK